MDERRAVAVVDCSWMRTTHNKQGFGDEPVIRCTSRNLFPIACSGMHVVLLCVLPQLQHIAAPVAAGGVRDAVLDTASFVAALARSGSVVCLAVLCTCAGLCCAISCGPAAAGSHQKGVQQPCRWCRKLHSNIEKCLREFWVARVEVPNENDRELLRRRGGSGDNISTRT